MSLIADGVWKAGVFATTLWAQNVWYEPASTPVAPPTAEATLDGGWMLTPPPRKPRNRKRDEESLFLTQML